MNVTMLTNLCDKLDALILEFNESIPTDKGTWEDTHYGLWEVFMSLKNASADLQLLIYDEEENQSV